MRTIVQYFFITLIFLVLVVGKGFCQTDLLMKSVLVDKEDAYDLMIELTLNTESIQFYNLEFNFFSGVSNGHPKRLQNVDSTYLIGKSNVHYLQFSMPKDSLENNINIEVVDRQGQHTHVFQQPIDEYVPLMLWKDGRPVMTPYVQPGLYQVKDSTIAFFYDHDFDYASPPMTLTSGTPQAMHIRDRIISATSIELEKQGVYLFQRDSIENRAFVVRTTPPYYPKLATVEQLTGPLNYISTNQERKILESIGNSKQKFDEFWLDLAGNREIAIKIIKHYYNRVEEANRRFSSFKEGWKTDMGMVYIIMGEPSKVEIVGNKAIWRYAADRYMPGRKYEFIKTTTIFSPAHYVLLRDKEYTNNWYDAIDLIRKGIIK